jgi:hypothetical protein
MESKRILNREWGHPRRNGAKWLDEEKIGVGSNDAKAALSQMIHFSKKLIFSKMLRARDGPNSTLANVNT